jgi:predicted dehydrogenase
MTELRFALFGTGFWASYQLAAWGECPGVRCVAVCDPVLDRAELLARRHSVPRVYSDAKEAYAENRLDFVDIVSDIGSHARLVRLAAEHGVPVICQKPMAPTLDECEDLVRTCLQAGVPFAIHENWRWQAPLLRVRERLAAGAIGVPFRARIDMVSGFDVFANQPGLRESPQFIVADMGCHLIDLARSLFGEADRIYCQIATVRPDVRGEDTATVHLAMNDRRVGVTINMGFPGTPLEHECFPQTLLFIEGNLGSIEVTPDFRVHLTTASGTHIERVPPPKYAWANPDYAVVHSSMVPCQAELVAALREGRPAETSAEDNLKTMRLVFAAYESARERQAVAIDQRPA